VVGSLKVLFVLSANDGSCGQNPGKDLDAQKTFNLLKPILRKLGVCFLPVINESKEFLEAVLEALVGFLPRSTELVMFLSTSHGRCNEICMNDEYMKIPHIIQLLGKLGCKNFLAMFDGCQTCHVTEHEVKETLDVAFVDKMYMVVYSAPPCCKAFWFEGVGIFVRCLAQVLEDASVCTLRQLADRVSEVLKVELPKHVLVLCPVNHQPVCVHNFQAQSVNYRDIIIAASKNVHSLSYFVY